MNFDEYEAAASRTINPALDDERRLMDAASGMSEEAGEVLGLIRKHLYQKRDLPRDALVKELGDVLWCLAITAKSSGTSLEEVARANIEKLRGRYPDGFE